MITKFIQCEIPIDSAHIALQEKRHKLKVYILFIRIYTYGLTTVISDIHWFVVVFYLMKRSM